VNKKINTIAPLRGVPAIALAASFDNSTEKGKGKGKNSEAAAPADASAPAAAKEAKTEAVILGIRSDVKPPENAAKRGVKSKYPFDQLEVGQSIAIKGRKAEGLASTVSSQNRKHLAQKKDENGAPMFEMTEVKNAEGVVTARVPDPSKPIMVATKKFAVYDVDPATDPDKADVRIFRTA
jgi:hypothetical protein